MLEGLSFTSKVVVTSDWLSELLKPTLAGEEHYLIQYQRYCATSLNGTDRPRRIASGRVNDDLGGAD